MNKILSLFSGAGGIDIGFKSNSFETYAAVDNWNIACDTLKKNKVSKNIICSDIKDVNFSKFKGKIDIVVGGPPCPPYSKSRFYIKEKKRALEDQDSYTLVYFCKALKIIKPKVFFFENVHGFFFKPHKPALDFFSPLSGRISTRSPTTNICLFLLRMIEISNFFYFVTSLRNC